MSTVIAELVDLALMDEGKPEDLPHHKVLDDFGWKVLQSSGSMHLYSHDRYSGHRISVVHDVGPSGPNPHHGLWVHRRMTIKGSTPYKGSQMMGKQVAREHGVKDRRGVTLSPEAVRSGTGAEELGAHLRTFHPAHEHPLPDQPPIELKPPKKLSIIQRARLGAALLKLMIGGHVPPRRRDESVEDLVDRYLQLVK